MSTLHETWDDSGIRADVPAPAQHRRSQSLLVSWLRALPEGNAAAFRYLLLLRFLLLNLVAVALLVAVWLRGWLDVVVAGNSSRLVVVIAAVFLLGLAGCARQSRRPAGSSAVSTRRRRARPRRATWSRSGGATASRAPCSPRR